MNKVSKYFKVSTAFATIVSVLTLACAPKENRYDASGTFEAVETIVSAEATGTLQAFAI
jgi:HlyD family secretion protein